MICIRCGQAPHNVFQYRPWCSLDCRENHFSEIGAGDFRNVHHAGLLTPYALDPDEYKKAHP